MSDNTKTVAIGAGLLLVLLFLTGAGGDKPLPKPPGDGPPKRPPPRDIPDTPPKDPPSDPPWVPGIYVPPADPADPPRAPSDPPRSPTDPPRKPSEPPPQVPSLGELTSDYPGPDRFYPVKYGDMFGGTFGDRSIAYRYLLSAGFLAAREAGQSEEEARAFARRVANAAANRTKATELIQCSGWNDALFGTYGWQDGKATPTSTGRAIRLLPVHSNVAEALADMQQPARNIALGTPNDRGRGNATGVNAGEGGSFELLWLPGLDLAKLWESGGTSIVVGDESWEDGSSRALPPPWVQWLGVYVPDNVNLTRFGCGAGVLEYE